MGVNVEALAQNGTNYGLKWKTGTVAKLWKTLKLLTDGMDGT